MFATGYPRPDNFLTEIVDIEHDTVECPDRPSHPLDIGYAAGRALVNYLHKTQIPKEQYSGSRNLHQKKALGALYVFSSLKLRSSRAESNWQLRATVGQNRSSVQMASAYHVGAAALAHVDSALDERSFQ